MAVLGPQRMVLAPFDAGLAGRAGGRLLGLGRSPDLAWVFVLAALALGLAARVSVVLAMKGSLSA